MALSSTKYVPKLTLNFFIKICHDLQCMWGSFKSILCKLNEDRRLDLIIDLIHDIYMLTRNFNLKI
jgi:hypothetical protein